MTTLSPTFLANLIFGETPDNQLTLSLGANREDVVAQENSVRDVLTNDWALQSGLSLEAGYRRHLGSGWFLDTALGGTHQPLKGVSIAGTTEDKPARYRNAGTLRLGLLWEPFGNGYARVHVNAIGFVGGNACKPIVKKEDFGTFSNGASVLGGDIDHSAGCVYDPKLNNLVNIAAEYGARLVGGLELSVFESPAVPSLFISAGHSWNRADIGIPGTNHTPYIQSTDGFYGEFGLRWIIPTSGKLDPPTVIATTPGEGEPPADVNTKITVTFNQWMDSQSLGKALTVTDSSGKQIDGYTNASVDKPSLTFEPRESLKHETRYTVSVAGAKNSEGIPMEKAYQWRFNTIQAVATSSVVVIPSVATTTTTAPVVVEGSVVVSEPATPAEPPFGATPEEIGLLKGTVGPRADQTPRVEANEVRTVIKVDMKDHDLYEPVKGDQKPVESFVLVADPEQKKWKIFEADGTTGIVLDKGPTAQDPAVFNDFDQIRLWVTRRKGQKGIVSVDGEGKTRVHYREQIPFRVGKMDSPGMTPAGKTTLGEVITEFRQMTTDIPNLVIEVQGLASRSGSHVLNFRLANGRGKTIRDLLAKEFPKMANDISAKKYSEACTDTGKNKYENCDYYTAPGEQPKVQFKINTKPVDDDDDYRDNRTLKAAED